MALFFYQEIKYISFANLRYNDHRYLPIIAIDNGVKKIKTFPVIHEKRKFGFSKYKMFKKVNQIEALTLLAFLIV